MQTVIDDRYVGDTNPLVMWMFDVDENDKEIPVKLVTDNCVVSFKLKEGENPTATIVGVNMTDEGYVEFPFAENTVIAKDYVWTVRIVNPASSENMIYEKGTMPIIADI